MECWKRIFFCVLLFGVNLYPSTQSNLSVGSPLESNKIMNMLKYECKDNQDCKTGYYCSNTNLCTECTDCKVYHREPGTQPCTKDPQHCGHCFTGFEPVILTNNRNKDYCKKSLTPSTPPLPSDYSLYYSIPFIVMGVFIFAVISICCLKKMALCKKLKYIKKPIFKDQSEESNNNYCQIPSTNNEESNTVMYQPEDSRNLCENPSNPNEFTFKEEEQNVQAGIFCRPYYDHHLTPTIANQPIIAHEPPTEHPPSAPPPYSPRSSHEPPITPVPDSTRNPESTASSDTVNSNSTPAENLDQNNLRVPSRQSFSMDAHAQNNVRVPSRQSSSMDAQERWWPNFPNFQIINKVLVSNVNDNSSKNMQNQINKIVAGSIEDSKKAQIYKSILQKN